MIGYYLAFVGAGGRLFLALASWLFLAITLFLYHFDVFPVDRRPTVRAKNAARRNRCAAIALHWNLVPFAHTFLLYIIFCLKTRTGNGDKGRGTRDWGAGDELRCAGCGGDVFIPDFLLSAYRCLLSK